MVMLVMSKDHTAFFEAYNDTSDLDGDGVLDLTYNNSIDYYGYFDSSMCYSYNSTSKYFEPVEAATSHYCSSGNWSGNFLNWVSMSRMDVLRKVLYGGHREVDNASPNYETVLRRVFLPDEGHSWAKVYKPTGTNDIPQLTPYNQTALTIYNVNCFSGMTFCANAGLTGYPVIRVAKGEYYNWDAAEVEEGYYKDGESYPDNDAPPSSERLGDFAVRVRACVPGYIGTQETATCKNYGGHYKPTGLLQKYGENDAIHFGLLSGSYRKNLSGGVLRKTVGSINNEINADGTFKNVSGIIKALNSVYLRNHTGGGKYTCYSTVCGPGSAMGEGTDGDRNWGNPISEMIYEAGRYFSGAGSPTSAFTDSNDYADFGFSAAVNWDDPFATHPYCSKPYIFVLSDIYPSYDDDQLPGSVFPIYGTSSTMFSGSLAGTDIITGSSKSIDVESGANNIGAQESLPAETFVGEVSGGTADGMCSEKSGYSLGNIRGVCPGYPQVRGSYYSAAVTHFAKTTDLHSTASGQQNPSTMVVALSNPLPTINVQLSSSNTVTISPVCVAWPADVNKKSNCSYVKSRIVPHADPNVGELEIVWEDSLQASDYDKDWTQRLRWTKNGSELAVENWVYRKTSGAPMELGYVITGTDADAMYKQLYSSLSTFVFDDSKHKCTPTSPATECVCKTTGSTASCTTTGTSGVYHLRKFNGGTGTAQYLKPPLWYAAKYGGFTDLNNNNLPDLRMEWTSSTSSDPDPDNYFFVANPAKLFEAVDKAFGQILQKEGSAGAVATVTQEVHQGDIVVRAAFEAYDETNPSVYTWQGHLETYRPYLGCSDFNDETVCRSITGCSWSGTACSGEMYGFQDPRYPSRFCNDLPDGHCWDGGERLRSQTHLNRFLFTWLSNAKVAFNPLNLTSLATPMSNRIDFDGDGNATSEGDQEIALNWTRGEDITATATRDRDGWILGDIVYSTPVVVGAPSRASVPRKAANLDCGSGVTDDRCFYNYLANHKHRKQMVYVGSNDAMLHAFNLGIWDSPGNRWVFDPADNATEANTLGKENWAYIPSNLLSELQDLAVSTYGTSAGCRHRYTVDLSPQAWEARIDHDKDSLTADLWRTVLLGGEREGGDVHFALDITNPDNATVLWEHSLLKDFPRSTAAASYTAYYDLLKTAPLSMSLPYMGRLNTTGSNDPYVAFFGGGIHAFRPDLVHASATLSLKQISEWKYLYYPTFHAVDLDTGTDLWKTTWAALLDDTDYLGYFHVNDNATYVLPHAISNVAAFDLFNESGISIAHGATQDGFTDVLFAGDYNGTLYNILETYSDNSTSPSCMITRKTKAITNANANPFRGSRQPITVTPVAALDDTGHLRVFFGTGKFTDVTEASNDRTDNATMTFYCMMQDVSAPIPCGDNTTTEITSITTPPFEVHEKCRASSGTYRWVKTEEISGQNVTHADGDNCFTCMYDFETPGERVIDSALVAGGYVFFTTFVPSTDPCVPSGTAYLYVLDYMCRPLSHVPIVEGGGVVVRYRDAKTGTWSSTPPAEVGAVKVSLGSGMPSRPVLDSKGENLLVQTSDARLVKLGVDLGGNQKAVIKGWTYEED
ncbi:MAG: hypothetical protein GX443_11015 [Deltaproteobacteria bacterium]|nr:hypothetical protein [Deltaproteobacteria bacterium]